MSLRDLWHTTYNLWLRVSEWYLFLPREAYRLCAWGVVVVMQSVSTGICWLVALFEKLKAASWFQVAQRTLLGIICQSCNLCLPNFNVFGNLGRNSMTEKLKGSLIAPVLMTSTSVTGSPCLCLDKRHCLSAKSTLPIRTMSKTLP